MPRIQRRSSCGKEWVSDDGSIRLVLGHCQDVLSKLNKGDADTVVTDPPYGVGVSYGSFNDTEENVIKLADQWLPKCRRIASVVAFTPGKLNEWIYPKPTWVLAWAMPSGAGRTCWGFQCHHPILVYGNDPYLKSGMGARPDCLFVNGGLKTTDCNHPCPKPYVVWKWLVNRVSPPQATVLDPMMGSGTTGVVCVRTGRKFIGIEINPDYFETAKQRIQNQIRLVQSDPSMIESGILESPCTIKFTKIGE